MAVASISRRILPMLPDEFVDLRRDRGEFIGLQLYRRRDFKRIGGKGFDLDHHDLLWQEGAPLTGGDRTPSATFNLNEIMVVWVAPARWVASIAKQAFVALPTNGRNYRTTWHHGHASI
jgi:hypothetical protein